MFNIPTGAHYLAHCRQAMHPDFHHPPPQLLHSLSCSFWCKTSLPACMGAAGRSWNAGEAAWVSECASSLLKTVSLHTPQQLLVASSLCRLCRGCPGKTVAEPPWRSPPLQYGLPYTERTSQAEGALLIFPSPRNYVKQGATNLLLQMCSGHTTACILKVCATKQDCIMH